MTFNKPIAAAALGALAMVAGELVSRGLVMLGIAQQDMYQITSLIVTLNRPSIIMGFVVNFIVGGAIAVILNYVLSRYGSDYIVCKAIAMGLAGWFILKMYTTAFIEGRYVDIRPMGDYYAHILGVLVFGVVLGWLFRGILFKRPTT